jgi:aldose 1-epimerase
MNGIERSSFGQIGAQAVDLYTLKNRRGSALEVTTYGATVKALHVPDRDGKLGDVVLGFDSLQGYVEHPAFFGATVGRVANRVRGASFVLDGSPYALTATDGAHHLHGGRRGWDKVVWSATATEAESGPALELEHVSVDGEEGYPGQVRASVKYTLTHEDALVVEMFAESDRKTLVNMAHHSYWNLGGHHPEGSEDVLGHELVIEADLYTPGDPVVPTGALAPVSGTPFDFRRSKPVGRDLDRTGAVPRGFDHNWVVVGMPGRVRPVAWLRDPVSGRQMSLESDAPGVQFYSGNFLDGSLSGKGRRYGRHAGLCLETQAFPNAINVPEWAGQVVLDAGQTYQHRMVHRFLAH